MSSTVAYNNRRRPFNVVGAARTAAYVARRTYPVARYAGNLLRQAYNRYSRTSTVRSTPGSYSPRVRRRMNMKKKKGKLLKKCAYPKKPGKVFAAKVNNVIDMDTPSGKMVVYNNQCPWLNTRNLQSVYWGNEQTVNGEIQEDYNDFSWQRVWNAANVMYKGYASTAASGNAGFTNVPGVKNFDYDTKVFVEKMTSTYTVKNNMNIAIRVSHYTCFPLTSDSENPRDVWNSAINQAYPAGHIITNINSGAAGNFPAAVSDYQYYGDKPTNYPLFNSKFKVNCQTKLLQPGEVYKGVRHGGCQVWYDFAKARGNTAVNYFYNNTPGMNQWSLFVYQVVHTNQQTDKLQAAAFGVQGPAATEGTAILTHTQNFSIRCPQETAIADKHNVLVRNNWIYKVANTTERTIVQGQVIDNKTVV